ncbi:MAG: small ribosomal subunit Rsm22 family protein [Parachlamydiaceae bacterium]
MKANRSPSTDLDTIIPLLIGIWRRFHKESGPGDRLQTREFRRVVDCIKKLQNGQDPSTDREMVSAYLLYPWLIHYQEALSLLGELPSPPKRVLDVCSGSAPFAFAALRYGASEVFAVDRNVMALELGAEVCGRYGLPLTIRRWDCIKEPLPVEGEFDVITLGHALNELFPSSMKDWQNKQSHFIHYLLSRLKPNGHLLLVESSYPDDNRRLLTLRDTLVEKEIFIQAPCIWQGTCPALKTPNSPCYAQREKKKPFLIKEIQRAAEIKLSSLKMTYLLIRSPKAHQLPLLTREMYRVISPPIETYQGNRYYLCGTQGKKTLSSHLKEHPPESRAFDYLRRGELIEITQPLEHGQSFEIVNGTQVTVLAACGKPAPNFEMLDDTF